MHTARQLCTGTAHALSLQQSWSNLLAAAPAGVLDQKWCVRMRSHASQSSMAWLLEPCKRHYSSQLRLAALMQAAEAVALAQAAQKEQQAHTTHSQTAMTRLETLLSSQAKSAQQAQQATVQQQASTAESHQVCCLSELHGMCCWTVCCALHAAQQPVAAWCSASASICVAQLNIKAKPLESGHAHPPSSA